MKLLTGKLNILIDGQFGSTGKGLLASYLAVTNHIDIAITNSSPNAGHTFYFRGQKYVTRHLPISGIINKRSTIWLCAGCIICVDTLLDEIRKFDVSDRVYIHPRAAIINKKDVENESSGAVAKIASTRKGVGQALIRKINREAKLAKDHPKLKKYIKELDVQYYLDQNCCILMEVPQGFDLSINSGLSYPHCTSREITICSAMSDAQVHPNYLGKVSVCLRTYPIRVGNIKLDDNKIGYSGPFYSDSVETTWSDISVREELTTNTKRVRRVATFSIKQYKKMLNFLKPDYIFLNFANYMNKQELSSLLDKLPEITHLGFGPEIKDVTLNHGHF